MKKITLLSLALLTGLFSMASQLVLIPTGSLEQTKAVFADANLTVHFYNDNMAIATAQVTPGFACVVLDTDAWQGNSEYFLLHHLPADREIYSAAIASTARILHQDERFLIVSAEASATSGLFPAVKGGIVRISRNAATFPPRSLNYQAGSLPPRDNIFAMLAQVDTVRLLQMVQHLQDFGTRNAYKAGGIEAQNWIFSKFDSLGLEVELHDFSMPGGPASDNVIATQTGTKYPDEYVVLGAHYDSYAGGSAEPGADDNATGTAGILEIARILSQYQFDRSIIFAAWSGEEYGLYGSEAWATEAAQNGMNILGYFNIDMAGYLQPGSYIHTDLIGPASANELKQFYRDVCTIYLPDFPVEPGALSGGDSDHTSFNNNGYQGIFPFEDSQNYSPYIHTSSDLVGLSVNNLEQHMTFVQATLACVVSMADMLPSPDNLTAIAGDTEIALEWTGVDSAEFYNIYRNSEPDPYATATELAYTDVNVTNGETYTYYVTAVFLNTGEESGPSNPVTVVPMPPIAFPFYDDFETGGPYWTYEGTWGLRNGVYHSPDWAMTESPNGNYAANLNISTSLRAINLEGATSAELSFWTRYRIESGYDYMYVEASTDGIGWDQLASFTGNQNTWTQKTYSLNNYLNHPNVIVRFRFYSDMYVEDDGMYIDDLELDVAGLGIGDNAPAGSKNLLHIRPNPAANHTSVDYQVLRSGIVRLELTDAGGKVIRLLKSGEMPEGTFTIGLDLSDLPNGIYNLVMEQAGHRSVRKVVVAR